MALGVLLFSFQEALIFLELTKRLPQEGPGRVCSPSNIPFRESQPHPKWGRGAELVGRSLLPGTAVRLQKGQNVVHIAVIPALGNLRTACPAGGKLGAFYSPLRTKGKTNLLRGRSGARVFSRHHSLNPAVPGKESWLSEQCAGVKVRLPSGRLGSQPNPVL